MSLVLIPVKFKAIRANGQAVVGATVRAVLTVAESDDGIIVPDNITGTTDVNGEITINLWPNSRGVNGSQYIVVIQGTDLYFSGLISVPEAPDTSWPIELETLINQPPYPSRSAAELAQLRAQDYMTQTKGYRDESLAAEAIAIAKAAAAATSETNATAKAAAAAASEANAASSAATLYGNAPIFTGTRPVATAAGVAAVASGQLFKTRQQFGHAVDVWKDNAGTAQWQEAQPFGVGALAAQQKQIEASTIESWVDVCGVPPDILIDPIEMFTLDGRFIPNAMKLLTNPPNKNNFSLGTGDIYFGQGGTPITRRVTGAGGGATGVEWTFGGANVNVDVINVVNSVTLDPGTYTVSCVGRSKTGSGAQNIQWFESSGNTTQIDAMVEGAYAAKSFTFTVAARAAVIVRLRSQATGTAFQYDRFFISEADGNATPIWSDDSAGMHCKNKVSARGHFVNSGFFWDTVNSLLSDTNVPLAADGLPVNINDLTVFASIQVPPSQVQANTAPIVTLSVVDGGGPVTYMMGLGNTTPEGPVSDGCMITTPTALETHRLCLKGDGFHVLGTVNSVETVQKCLDGLIYRDIPRTGTTTPILTTSHLGICNYQNATTSKGNIGQIAIWINKGGSGGLKPFTAAQVKGIMRKMKKHVIARGGTMASFRDILLTEGDSRNNYSGVDPNGPSWNWQLGAFEYFGAGKGSLKVPQVGWGSSILGNPGDVLPGSPTTDINYVGSTLWSRRAKVLALIQACHELGLRIHMTWLNDINDTVRIPANAVTYCDAERVLMADYYAALEAGGLGSQLGLFTCMPRHTDAAFEAARPTVNAERRNTAKYGPGVIHRLLDVAADPVMGLYSATTAPPGWVDTLHPNKAGGTIIADTYVKPWLAPRRLY